MPWSFEEDVDAYTRLGVEAIEICEEKLVEGHAAEQLALVAQSGLSISSAQPEVRTIFPSRTQPEPKEPGERASRFRRTFERFGELAEGVPFVLNTGPAPGGNMHEVMEVAIREGRALAEYALEYGASIALEPLSPLLMNVESAIWTLEQAMQIVTAVDHPSFGICLDFWNIWQNPAVADQIRACGDHILVVHVSDWRPPRSLEDRHVVGEGEIPLADLIRATRESGYRGAYTLEIFSRDVPDSLWEREGLAAVITESREGLQRVFREARVHLS
jgi:sugar phosphate isomerase/epimerase